VVFPASRRYLTFGREREKVGPPNIKQQQKGFSGGLCWFFFILYSPSFPFFSLYSTRGIYRSSATSDDSVTATIDSSCCCCCRRVVVGAPWRVLFGWPFFSFRSWMRGGWFHSLHYARLSGSLPLSLSLSLFVLCCLIFVTHTDSDDVVSTRRRRRTI
jgi:hypothetical protein